MDPKMDKSEEEGALFLLAMRLAAGSVLPMALKSAIELDLLQLINKSGAGSSASELAALLPTTNPHAADMIDRILRLLAAHSVLTCTMDHGGVERRYSLAPVCKFLTPNEDGVSVAPFCLLLQDRVFMESWYHMSDAILKGGVPFNRAHGMSLFEYPVTDSRFNTVFNQAMHNQSTIFMKKILETYKGFEGVKSLVDVAGGTGASSKLIVSKFPSIKAINFDLPHVIQHASPHPGVEHVGGDMFVGVPKADAIFMKWICHDWSDTKCLKLLRNCYSAVPEDGKVIIAESIIPENPNSEAVSALDSMADVGMLTLTPSGRERTEMEFRALARQAGFKRFVTLCAAFNTWIMELHKSN